MGTLECPNCGEWVNKLIYPPTLRGNEPAVCCEQCRNNQTDKKVYTGKKLWREDQVYTRDQLKEKNYDFEQRIKKSVADQYKNMRKSTRMKMFGY